MSKTILLIHGAWLTPLCWGRFKRRYEAAGYEVVAPPWPLMDMSIDQLRTRPHPKLKKLTIGKLVDHYEKLVRALPESPILMGHSFGGLVVQKLLDRGLGQAGVIFDSVPVGGIVPSLRMLRSALPVLLSFFGWNRVFDLEYKHFSETFAQTLPEDRRRSFYDRYWVPAPGRIYYQAAIGIGMGIEVGNKDRAPLLLIAGEKDLTVTPADVDANYRKQQRSPAITSYKSFPDRSHFLCVEPGWEEVADYALEWASQHQKNALSDANVLRRAQARLAIA